MYYIQKYDVNNNQNIYLYRGAVGKQEWEHEYSESTLHFLFNIVLIIIIMRDATVELSFAFSLVMVGLFINGLIQYYMYAKLSGKARLELDYELLKQKNDSDKRLYKEKKEQSEEVARLNHDMQNHLTYDAYNIKNAKYEKAEY